MTSFWTNKEGLERTINWYFGEHDRELVRMNLSKILIERRSSESLELGLASEPRP